MFKILFFIPLLFLFGCKGDSAGIVVEIPQPPVVPLVLSHKLHTPNLATSSTSSGGYKVNLSIQTTPQYNFNLSNGYSVELSVK